ncbi:hypothetical protein Tco_0671127 [Tanacetum coccineum]
MWGDVLELGDCKDECFARKRLCIKTNRDDNILEKFKIIVKGKSFVVRAKELFVWSPSFVEVTEADDIHEEGEFIQIGEEGLEKPIHQTNVEDEKKNESGSSLEISGRDDIGRSNHGSFKKMEGTKAEKSRTWRSRALLGRGSLEAPISRDEIRKAAFFGIGGENKSPSRTLLPVEFIRKFGNHWSLNLCLSVDWFLHQRLFSLLDAGNLHLCKRLTSSMTLSLPFCLMPMMQFLSDDMVPRGNLTGIMHTLRCFSLLSGLSINLKKSQLLGVGIPESQVLEAATLIEKGLLGLAGLRSAPKVMEVPVESPVFYAQNKGHSFKVDMALSSGDQSLWAPCVDHSTMSGFVGFWTYPLKMGQAVPIMVNVMAWKISMGSPSYSASIKFKTSARKECFYTPGGVFGHYRNHLLLAPDSNFRKDGIFET